MKVDSNEQVVRLIHRMWIVEGELQLNAFTLNDGETYLSVNRPAVDSYLRDVKDFLTKHIQYTSPENNGIYRRAVLAVNDIQDLSVSLEKENASLSVEVEPRDSHYKSHAGIFTRIDGKNIKGGSTQSFTTTANQVVSADAILQKVRMHLLRLSKVEVSAI